MVFVSVQPDFGLVVSPVAVDVEVHFGVGDGGDPVSVSRGVAEVERGVLSMSIPVLAAAVPEWDDL
jgi:hypothetical protein